MERIVEIEKLSLEKEEDIRLRPTCWDDYIGQEKLKRNLQVFITAAKMRGEVLDHLLLFGPPGSWQDDFGIYYQQSNANFYQSNCCSND